MNKIKILHEDNHTIIVDKEAGLLTQGDSSGDSTLFEKIKNLIKEKYNKTGNVFLGIVQRLDKPVSGTIVFAKTSKAAKRLNEEFKKRNVIKLYIAIVHGGHDIEEGKWHDLKHHISKNDGYVKIYNTENENSKPAILKFIKIFSNNNSSLFLIQLETGLKHQIRAQLSKIGFPIIGDQKYGSVEKIYDNSILLHSYYLEFIHPTTREKIEIFSEIPSRFLDKINIDSKIEKKIFKIIKDLT